MAGRRVGALVTGLALVPLALVIGAAVSVILNPQHDSYGGPAPLGPSPPQIGIRYTLDGRAWSWTQSDLLPVFVGHKVTFELDVTVPAGAKATCLSVALEYPRSQSERCKAGLGGTQLLEVAQPLGSGVHKFALSWTAIEADWRQPNGILIGWDASAPQNSITSGPQYSQSGFGISMSVIPSPEAATTVSSSGPQPLVPECGLTRPRRAPTVLLLDCRSGAIYMENLRWLDVGGQGVATGTVVANQCLQPVLHKVCGGGDGGVFVAYNGRVVLRDVRRVDGRLMWTRATVMYHIPWAFHQTIKTYTLVSSR